jgi:hypothetical protein
MQNNKKEHSKVFKKIIGLISISLSVFFLVIMVTTALQAKVRFIGDEDDQLYEAGVGVGSGAGDPTDQKYECDTTKYKYKCSATHYPKVGVGGSCGGYYSECQCPRKYKYACSSSDNLSPNSIECEGKYTDCKCAAGYNKTCSGDYVGSDKGCTWPEGGTTYYKECICNPTKFLYASCGSGYKLAGTNCGGKFERCDCVATAVSCQYGCATTNCAGCASCASKPVDPCEGVTPKGCNTGFTCKTRDSCGNCTKCVISGQVSDPSECECSATSCSGGYLKCTSPSSCDISGKKLKC